VPHLPKMRMSGTGDGVDGHIAAQVSWLISWPMRACSLMYAMTSLREAVRMADSVDTACEPESTQQGVGVMVKANR